MGFFSVEGSIKSLTIILEFEGTFRFKNLTKLVLLKGGFFIFVKFLLI